MRVAGILCICIAVLLAGVQISTYSYFSPLYSHKSHLWEVNKDCLGERIDGIDTLSEDELTAAIFKLKMESSEFELMSRRSMESTKDVIAWLGTNAKCQFAFKLVSFKAFEDAYGEGKTLIGQMTTSIAITVVLIGVGLSLIVVSFRQKPAESPAVTPTDTPD